MTPEQIFRLRHKYLHECRDHQLKNNLMKLFEFTQDQYQQFETMLTDLNTQNWGAWDNSKWITFPGLPRYSLHQYIQERNEKTFVTVTFDSAVKLPDGRQGRKFKVGGSRNYRPVCDWFR